MAENIETKKLWAKEKAAIQYFCNPGSGSYNNWCESYKKAGYSLCEGWKRNALKVRHKNHIEAAIIEKQAKIAKKIDVTTSEIISELRKLAGLDEGAKKLNNKERLRALELLGKHKAMFTDRIEQQGVQINIKPEDEPERSQEGLN